VPLGLNETRRIAAEVLEADHPSLHLVGVATEGGSSYAEIIVTIANCHEEPCRLSIGVQRDLSEAAFRREFSDSIRSHVRQIPH
jgi:hypothetical protein